MSNSCFVLSKLWLMALTYGPGEVAGAFYLNQQQSKHLEGTNIEAHNSPDWVLQERESTSLGLASVISHIS